MTPDIAALLKETDDLVERGYYTSPERFAAAIRALSEERDKWEADADRWRDAMERAIAERDTLRADVTALKDENERMRQNLRLVDAAFGPDAALADKQEPG